MQSRMSKRQYQHWNKVDGEKILARFSNCRKYRWSLDIPYKPEPGRSETVAVILKNPSSACKRIADRTVRNVEEVIHREFPKAARLTILNLFAYRATYARDVRGLIRRSGVQDAIGKANDHAIRRVLRCSDHVVAAWGAQSSIPNPEYCKRVRQIARMLRPHRTKLWYIGCLSQKGKHPRHGMRWSPRHHKQRLPPIWRWLP